MDQVASAFVTAASLTNVTLVGEGLGFSVYRANSERYGDVALRIPKFRVFENVNDPHINSEDLLRQELAIYKHLKPSGVPVPRPYHMLEIGGNIASLAGYVESDGSTAGPGELGRVLALLHRMSPPTGLRLVCEEGLDALHVLPRRITRRWAEIGKFVPDLPSIPSEGRLGKLAQGLSRFPPCLVHLDFRGANLRVQGGKITAVTDWENSLIGPAAMDVYRVLELEKPGPEFLQAYLVVSPLPDVTKAEELLVRLDPAIVLALVFLSEAPDPERAKVQVNRVIELAKLLQQELPSEL